MLGQKLLGKRVNTPAVGEYPGDVATVIQLAPDENAPETAFQVNLPQWGKTRVQTAQHQAEPPEDWGLKHSEARPKGMDAHAYDIHISDSQQLLVYFLESLGSPANELFQLFRVKPEDVNNSRINPGRTRLLAGVDGLGLVCDLICEPGQRRGAGLGCEHGLVMKGNRVHNLGRQTPKVKQCPSHFSVVSAQNLPFRFNGRSSLSESRSGSHQGLAREKLSGDQLAKIVQ